MSKKQRRMATIKSANSSANLTRWVRLLSVFVVVLGVGAGALHFNKPIIAWFHQLSFSAETTASGSESINLQDDSSGWQVALVKPTEFVSARELEHFVKATLDDSFFSLDVKEASNVLLSHPWIKSIKARKVWPNTLLVDVEEHQPWLNLNNKQLISREGVVFEPANASQFIELPLLMGQYGELEDLLSMYHFFTEQMPANEFRITKLSFNAHNGWTMWLENEIALYLGKQHLTERLERFLTVLDEMKNQQRNQVAYIDLRYQSGVAVGWKVTDHNEQIAGK